jgi:hypothetical protein
MKRAMVVVLVVLVALLAGCGLPSVTGSGNVVTREFALTGFDKVDISHGFTVDISQGDTFSVVIRIDDNLVEYLEVVKQGSTLRIRPKPVPFYTGWNATLEAQVTMPELTGLDLSGGNHATITGFKSTKALDVDLSGGCQLRGDIEAGNASFDLSEGNDVTLTGSAEDLTIEALGGSGADLSAFAVENATVVATGGSQVTVNAKGMLVADALGGSEVYYLGNPTSVTSNASGGSEVRPK